MKKILMVFVSLLFFAAAHADSFDDFKKESMSGFESSKDEFASYKKETEKEFETYKKIMEEEFEAYKGEILKNWDNAEVSTNTKWVEYLNNYRIRKTVDFETKEIKIDIIGGTSADLKPVLKDLLKEDRANAFRRDPVAFNTETKLRQQVPKLVTAKVDDTPVVSGLFTDKTLSDHAADTLADKLISQSQTSSGSSDKTGKPFISMKVSLPDDTYKKAASGVMPSVEKYAVRFKMDQSLVLSVIYNESRFNPLAKSYVPAYGLMQIVPKSAGIDAMLFLEGKKSILAPSYLYDPDNNVKVGAAYLHILYYRYFRNVTDPQSRLYCAIAAYNTGAGNVAYAFNGNNGKYNIDKAVPIINSMSPSQVYSHLKNGLTYEEARKYLVNVSSKMKDY